MVQSENRFPSNKLPPCRSPVARIKTTCQIVPFEKLHTSTDHNWDISEDHVQQELIKEWAVQEISEDQVDEEMGGDQVE